MKVKHQYLMTCMKLAVISKLTGQSLTCDPEIKSSFVFSSCF